MDIKGVTIGFPVSDLAAAAAWYQKVFGLQGPDLEPVEGILEFQVGPVWLQLDLAETQRSGAEVVARFEVGDAIHEHDRLTHLDIDAQPVERVEGLIEFFDVRDPDGNALSFYTLLGDDAEG